MLVLKLVSVVICVPRESRHLQANVVDDDDDDVWLLTITLFAAKFKCTSDIQFQLTSKLCSAYGYAKQVHCARQVWRQTRLSEHLHAYLEQKAVVCYDETY